MHARLLGHAIFKVINVFKSFTKVTISHVIFNIVISNLKNSTNSFGGFNRNVLCTDIMKKVLTVLKKQHQNFGWRDTNFFKLNIKTSPKAKGFKILHNKTTQINAWLFDRFLFDLKFSFLAHVPVGTHYLQPCLQKHLRIIFDLAKESTYFLH